MFSKNKAVIERVVEYQTLNSQRLKAKIQSEKAKVGERRN
jgi:hypothetical protein